MSLCYLVEPSAAQRGNVRVPGDKSISHRALLMSAIAEGTTIISGFLAGHDTLATLRVLQAMGVIISEPQINTVADVMVQGVGLTGLQAPNHALDCGNSGTSMRLLAGLLAGQGFEVELIGDPSLSRRPMQRVVTPLMQMGAHLETAANGYPPLKIFPSNALQGIEYRTPVASAQIKSALLLAGLYARGTTTVIEPTATRDHTERMLAAFGIPLIIADNRVSVQGVKESKAKLMATSIAVPADISSAAFFMVAASITPGSDIVLSEVGINPTRTGVIDILQAMGADITFNNLRMLGGEPVADIHVRYAPLHGITIPEAWVPRAIDEFPVLFIAAANAQGETVLTGAHELRVKESDRIQAMAEGLTTLGVSAIPSAEGICIRGSAYGGGEIKSYSDHRIAMAFTVAGITARAPITIHDCDNVATSFPNFVELAQQCGMKITPFDI